ncbi:MAG: helix-turn-helix domain-containing protein [Nanoarchaeota archaeon]
MNEKYVMLNLDDEKLESLAEVLNNKTAKKIVSYLAEKEASEGDLAKELNIPANTVNYNIKKLVESGLIETSKNYFWSVKGKKIPQYKVSKKIIMISPKSSSSTKALLSAFLATGIMAFLIKIYTSRNNGVQDISAGDMAISGTTSVKSMAEITVAEAPSLLPSAAVPELWVWFLLGGLTALVFYMLLNWRRL